MHFQPLKMLLKHSENETDSEKNGSKNERKMNGKISFLKKLEEIWKRLRKWFISQLKKNEDNWGISGKICGNSDKIWMLPI